MNWRQNMISYLIKGPGTTTNPLDTLRVVFYSFSSTPNVIPAVYCSDYYAEEIAAEKSGLSNSTFYTDKYADEGSPYWSKWICPDLTKSMIVKDQL